jgi:sugar lactone lactonase YvrE
MNASHDIERELARWMEVVAPSRAPDNLAPSIIERTGSLRPRPGWLVRLLEPPMQTQLSLRNYLGFGRSPRLILVGLLILALAVGGVIAGSQLLRQHPLPPPFGLAGNGLMAVDIDGSITVMEPDGSNIRRLALPFVGVKGMSFSRDGTRIAAWATSDPTRADEKSLIVANADGSASFAVGSATYTLSGINQIAWSPDSQRLAFTDGNDRLLVVNLADGTARELAPDVAVVRRRDPNWAPDGRLAYRCETGNGVLHLCVTSADLANERIQNTSPGTEWAFQRSSWSHDGTQIAYYVDDTIDRPPTAAGFDIAVIDLATGTERILTRGFAPDTILPIWTPDDRHVLFTTDAGPGVVAADGTGLKVLGDTPCGWFEPSPDGRLLTCVSGQEVVLYPINGDPSTVIELGGGPEFVNWQRLAT